MLLTAGRSGRTAIYAKNVTGGFSSRRKEASKMLVLIKTNNSDMTLTAEKPALIKLSPNFTLAEMANNAGDAAKPQYIISAESDAFISTLQAFRNIVNQRVIINSGYRQFEYNKKIGGDPNSRHLYGCAADIRPLELANFTEARYINTWFEALAQTKQHGAINIYADRSYYHLETNTGARLLTVRVYKDIDLYNKLYLQYNSPFIAVQKF